MNNIYGYVNFFHELGDQNDVSLKTYRKRAERKFLR
jgi:hypothetical protein